MISSEWGAPKAFLKGFDLEDLKAGKSFHRLVIWVID